MNPKARGHFLLVGAGDHTLSGRLAGALRNLSKSTGPLGDLKTGTRGTQQFDNFVRSKSSVVEVYL